jgi:dTDP-4-amino-4,6-dideoxygalactose transaminase
MSSTLPEKKSDRIFLSAPHMSGNEIDYVRQAFESNYIAPVGPQLNQFEAKFREITGFEHCVAVANGTCAIHLALRTLGVQQDDIVLASTLTFIGSVAAATYQKAELVFIDSERETWNMDPNLLEQEIKSLVAAGKRPAAVLPTDIYGQPCDLDVFRDICDPYDIPIISDSAESLGASYKDRHVGHRAKVATFSFNGNKIITTSGGGMIASDDQKLIEHCKYLSTQAREPVLHYEHKEVGYNYRMSNLLAAVGIGQLEVLKDRVNKKREITQMYQNFLGDVSGIQFMPEASYGRCNRWLTVIKIDSEKFGATPLEVIAALEAQNIESRPVWNPLHKTKAFANSRVVGGEVAESLYRDGICLPSGTIMEEEDIQRISEIIKTLKA